MKRNKVIIGLIITLVFIAGCSNFRYVPEPKSKRGKPIPVLTTTVYSGNFSTEEIRDLWMTCSVKFSSPSFSYQTMVLAFKEDDSTSTSPSSSKSKA